MALIVETGQVVAGANCYVSLEDCTSYHQLRGNSAWTGADTDKETAIVRAAQYLNGLNWQGYKTNFRNPLAWPRNEVVLEGGNYLSYPDYSDSYFPSNEVPQEVIDANCELALRALTSNLNPDLDRGGMIIREKVDVLETEYAPGAPPGWTRPTVDTLLAPYLMAASSIRLVRA